MLRYVFLVALALAIAFGGGVGSVWLALHHPPRAAPSPGWHAVPTGQSPDERFYREPAAAQRFALPLGANEGIRFMAALSDDGTLLRGGCDYLIAGVLPASRFWTLFAADDALRPLRDASSFDPKLQSFAVLREGDGGVTLTASSHPSSGNWLPLPPSGAIVLVLALYDTPAANGVSPGSVVLPRITRLGCDD